MAEGSQLKSGVSTSTIEEGVCRRSCRTHSAKTEAPPSAPVRVSGLSDVPEAGDRFYVLDNISLAKQLAEEHQLLLRQRALIEQRKPRTLEAVFEQMATTEAKELPLIIKADVQGSVEALQDNLEKIEHPEVRVHVIHAGVGGIGEETPCAVCKRTCSASHSWT